MTSVPHGSITTPALSEPPGAALRLRLKPEASAAGYVDGAWWPRSRDLAAELREWDTGAGVSRSAAMSIAAATPTGSVSYSHSPGDLAGDAATKSLLLHRAADRAPLAVIDAAAALGVAVSERGAT